jgi:dipeptidyl aminopeptidase/acylaminoacyl peptidase
MNPLACGRVANAGRLHAAAAMVSLVLLVSPVRAAAPPAEAYGAMPAESHVVLNPEGQYLAWMQLKGDKPQVVIYDVLAHKVQRMMSFPSNGSLRGMIWGDSGILLVSFSETDAGSDPKHAFTVHLTTALDAKGGEGRVLPAKGDRGVGMAASATLVSAITSKPHTALMASGSVLMEVDTLTGQAATIKWGNSFTQDWVVDRGGKPVAREDWDWLKQAYRVYALHGETVKEILRKDDSSHPLLAGLLPDASAVVVLAANGRPYQAAWAYPLDGSAPRIVAEDPEADVSSYFTDPNTGAIVSVYVNGSKNYVHWLDPAAQQRFDALRHTFAGRDAIPYTWTADGTKALVEVDSPVSPPVYYLVDFAAHKADIAAEEYPQLAKADMGEFRQLTYKARDGTDIPAYLTLPVGKAAGAVPMVVLPHAGPNWRDHPDFNWMVQFLASRGYAVLQPQFRGSTGYGEAFREAGYRQWGGLMQDDVTDGVHAMVEQGIADPKHICIAGISYGGYVALAGAAFTPKLYACAISIEGVTDLRRLEELRVPVAFGTPATFGGSVRAVSAAASYWKERIGAEGDSSLDTKSPINSVDKIEIPVLIIYSGASSGDAQQSGRMAEAMAKAGKQATVVKLPGDSHWLSRSETRTQVLTEMETFLKAHL